MNLDRLEEYPWTYEPLPPEEAGEFLKDHRTLDSFEVAGLRIVCPVGIYHPTEFSSTRFMYRGIFNELHRLGRTILEVGTGSGTLGICLAAAGKVVTMVDIDPAAVECARNNARINRIDVRVLSSDLFEAVRGETFDFIFFNIPLLDKEVEGPIEVMACDPGGTLFARFMREAPAFLAPGGAVCITVSNLGNRAAILEALSGYDYRVIFSEYYSYGRTWKALLLAHPRKT